MIDLPAFAESTVCRSGFSCELCRDRDGGRIWRAAVAKGHSTPDGAVDFPCPEAKPWGWKKPAPGDLGPLRVSVIITVFAQGPDLEATVACLMAGADTPWPLSIEERKAKAKQHPCPVPDEILIVDDETPESCGKAVTGHRADLLRALGRLPGEKESRVRVERLVTRRGNGGARAAATRMATGDVLVFTDAHMRFGPNFTGSVVQAIRRNPDSMLTFGSVGIYPGLPCAMYGGHLHVRDKDWVCPECKTTVDILSEQSPEPAPNCTACAKAPRMRVQDGPGKVVAKWIYHPQGTAPQTDHRVGAPLGACYAVRKSVLEAAGGFPDYFHGYSFDEEYLGVALHLCGFSVVCVPGIVTGHNYDRWQHWNQIANWEVEYNTHAWHRVVFEDGVYERDFEPRMFAYNPDPAVTAMLDRNEELIQEARRRFHRLRKMTDCTLWKRWGIKPFCDRPMSKPCGRYSPT